MVPSFVLGSQVSSTYPHGKERVLARLGRVGEMGTPPGFSALRPRGMTILSISKSLRKS